MTASHLPLDFADDDDLAAVRAADPCPEGRLDGIDLSVQYSTLLGSVREVDLATKRRRRRGPVIAAVAAALTLASGGGVAAAVFHSAHTGDRPSDPRLSDHTELLDTSGDDFPTIARHLVADVPFPPGDGPGSYLGTALPTAGQPGTYISTAGVRTFLSTDAVCAWEGYWLQADRGGDQAGRSRATAVLAKVPGWSQLMGSSDAAGRAGYRAIARAARAGNAAPIDQDWSANCTELPRKWEH